MKDFKKLNVWERAHKFALETYKITRGFPKEELYSLTDQIRRSSTSIPTNIAEGCGRDSDLEFKRFLIIAMGSSSELEYQLLLAFDLGYIESSSYKKLNNGLIEIRKMLNSLIQKIKADN